MRLTNDCLLKMKDYSTRTLENNPDKAEFLVSGYYEYP